MLTTTSTAGVTTTYGYDQNGDTTGISSTAGVSTNLSYDSQARLDAVKLADGTLVLMTYNAQGQRVGYSVSKTGVTSESEQVTYRGDELAQAVISNTQRYTDTYLYDPDGAPLELLRQTKSGNTLTTARYWYVRNGHGDVVALTDVSGTVVDSYSYDLWGRLTSAVEAMPQRLRYAGYWYDQELGWYWVAVRAYNPTLMRWLQPDPSQQDGVRTYVYVGDDPVDATDPSGLSQNPPPCSAYTNQTICEGGTAPPPTATPTPGAGGGQSHLAGPGAVPFRGDTPADATWKSPDGQLRMAFEELHVNPADAKFPGAHVNLQVFRKFGKAWRDVTNWHIRLEKPRQFGQSWFKVKMRAGDNHYNLDTGDVEGEGKTLADALADAKRKLASKMLSAMEEKGLISVAERQALYDGLVGELEDAAATAAEDAGAGLLDTVIDFLLSSLILN